MKKKSILFIISLLGIIGLLSFENYRLKQLIDLSHLKVQVFDQVIDLPINYVVVSGGFAGNSPPVFFNGLNKKAYIGKITNNDSFLDGLSKKQLHSSSCKFQYGEKKFNNDVVQVIYDQSEQIVFINENIETIKKLLHKLCVKTKI